MSCAEDLCVSEKRASGPGSLLALRSESREDSFESRVLLEEKVGRLADDSEVEGGG